MRHALTLFCLALPLPAMADDFVVSSKVSDATVYPTAAAITRGGAFSVPAGNHRLILTDMPFIDPSSLRLSASGLTLGTVSYREDFVPPRGTEDSAGILAAQDRIDGIEAQIAEVDRRAAAVGAEVATANAQVTFLDGLGSTDAAADPARLQDLLALVGSEGLAARQRALEAQARADAILTERKPLEEDLAEARAALAALQNEQQDRAYMVIEVEADAPAEGTLTIDYITRDAGWKPAYDISLTTQGKAPDLTIDRLAYVSQATGENWQGVNLHLSTARPSGQSAPGEVRPLPLRISDPVMVQPYAASGAPKLDSAPVMELARTGGIVAERAAPDGINVEYAYPRPVDIATGADDLRLDLGSQSFVPEVYADAVPLLDSEAYLMAAFTNDSGDPLLSSGAARFYRDGTFIGERGFSFLPAGEEEALAFGPIDGLRLSRVLDDRIEGDRGLIRKSNQQSEAVTLSVRNLTDRAWDVRLTDRVPYSEQEDLRIEWQASPMPAVQDYDDQPGVLQWRFPITAGETQDIELAHTVTWPEGKVLR